ncbi:MAG TPA: hypothetical protein VEA99_20230 [Gemmatimonadaceae bacterium]|nr:hypothetical protein [Gemmatimonadaceae bacterium]
MKILPVALALTAALAHHARAQGSRDARPARQDACPLLAPGLAASLALTPAQDSVVRAIRTAYLAERRAARADSLAVRQQGEPASDARLTMALDAVRGALAPEQQHRLEAAVAACRVRP